MYYNIYFKYLILNVYLIIFYFIEAYLSSTSIIWYPCGVLIIFDIWPGGVEKAASSKSCTILSFLKYPNSPPPFFFEGHTENYWANFPNSLAGGFITYS